MEENLRLQILVNNYKTKALVFGILSLLIAPLGFWGYQYGKLHEDALAMGLTDDRSSSGTVGKVIGMVGIVLSWISCLAIFPLLWVVPCHIISKQVYANNQLLIQSSLQNRSLN